MNARNFEKIVSEISGRKIFISELVNQDAKKWYDKKYVDTDIIKEGTIYGVCVDDVRMICFDLKVGKFENLLKTFVTQYVNKYLCTTWRIDEDGSFVKHTKETAKSSLHEVSPRYGYLCAYSTQYGIGVWNLFVNADAKELIKRELSKLLTESNVTFKNEYSDAFWAYRFKFSGNYLDHNIILKKLEENLNK